MSSVLQQTVSRMFHAWNSNMVTHRSLVIIKMPCTRIPFVIWGPIPLNNPRTPSFSYMNCSTSQKLLNGLPFLDGGGLDCRPTFATMRGCVATVARALDSAPRTIAELVSFHLSWHRRGATYQKPAKASIQCRGIEPVVTSHTLHM